MPDIGKTCRMENVTESGRAGGRHWSPWRKESRGDVLSGCGWGCFGCLAAPLLFVAFSVVVVLLPGRHWEKWSGFPEVLDGLRPGMTVEEAKAVFPAHCRFEEKERDWVPSHTWMADPGAVPARMLEVLPGDPKGFLLTWGALVTRISGGADVFFDNDGRLVGVHEIVWEDHFRWEAKWGTLKE